MNGGLYLGLEEEHMSVTCPVGFDVASLRAEVQAMYTRVATSPEGDFSFSSW
jgi:hypothetical protein